MEFDIEIPADQFARLQKDTELEAAASLAAVARECEEELRSRARTRWPQLTGFSRDRWRADDIAHRFEILVSNTAIYAKFVNNIQRFSNPSAVRQRTGFGGSNPHYRSAQRTIIGAWDEILARSVRRADRAVRETSTVEA